MSRSAVVRPPHVLLVMMLALTAFGTGCDKIKERLRGGVDKQWLLDSAFLATNPDILFRVTIRNDRMRAIPIATIGREGIHDLHFGDRGWKAFDVQYLSSTAKIYGIRNGRVAEGTTNARGMWEPPTQALDTINYCRVIPGGLLSTEDRGMRLATSAPPYPLKYGGTLDPGALQEAIERVPLLVAPTVGVPASMIQHFTRKLYQVQSGSGDSPTIVLVYDDPVAPPDSGNPIAERPHNLIVVLDKGMFGYKPSWTFKTPAMRDTPPRLHFLDYADIDGDGRAELFFGADLPTGDDLGTIALRFDNDVWHEVLRFRGLQCDQ